MNRGLPTHRPTLTKHSPRQIMEFECEAKTFEPGENYADSGFLSNASGATASGEALVRYLNNLVHGNDVRDNIKQLNHKNMNEFGSSIKVARFKD